MWHIIQYLVTLSLILKGTSGLYFHIAETERKCFIEEIPDETTVIGISLKTYLLNLINLFIV